MGDDITYSGTVAGAMEGCAFGIPSIVLSQAYDEHDRATIDWSAAREHGPALVRRLMDCGWPKGVLLNVNFPGCAAPDVRGVVAVPQGTYDLMSTEIIQRKDVRQRAYYWIGLRHRESDPVADSDLGAVRARKISVTPLHLNLTEMAVLKKMKKALG
jgi:5'-nucleotidase